MSEDGQGDLLIITHAALQMIAHWRNKDAVAPDRG